EKRLAGFVVFDGSAVFLEYGADRLAYGTVVVDDEDNRLPLPVRCCCGTRRARGRRGNRCREETLDGLRELLQLHRLVELRAVAARDVAQRAGRCIAGQNNDGNLAA